MKPGSSRRPGAAVGTAASDPSGTPPRCIARTTDRSKETLLAPTPNSTSPPRPRRRLELVGTLLAFLALTGLASESAGAWTSPYYRGSRLSLDVRGKPRTGHLTRIVAEGRNRTDMPGGLALIAFAKRPQLDRTCAKTYDGEVNKMLGNPSEAMIDRPWHADLPPAILDGRCRRRTSKSCADCSKHLRVATTSERLTSTTPTSSGMRRGRA
jgi:hypothetical protein